MLISSKSTQLPINNFLVFFLLYPIPATLCEQCGKEFFSEQRLKIHRVVHEEPKFACDHCPKKFRMKAALDRHSDLHRNVKYVCDVCGVKLCSYFARYKHMSK